MKIKNAPGFFDTENRFAKLDGLNDPLAKLNEHINFEIFRPALEAALAKKDTDGSKGGRPAFDVVFMFKVLIIQKYFNLSDEAVEFQILDRATFMRFLGIGISDAVPDSKTVWHFRNRLCQAGSGESLFELFVKELNAKGLIANEGKIVDASFVEAPRQRNTESENMLVKHGFTPLDWRKNPHKLAQKDVDARWARKGRETHFGYKVHTKVDAKSKLVEKLAVTPAQVHDSQALEKVLAESDSGQMLYADSAYRSEEIEQVLAKKGIVSSIHEKRTAGKPLTEEQKALNTKKSRIRVRVEHVFGFIENTMGGSVVRCIGIVRAEFEINMMSLCYNLARFVYLVGPKDEKKVKRYRVSKAA